MLVVAARRRQMACDLSAAIVVPRHTGRQALAELIEGVVEGAGADTAPLHPPRMPVTVA